MRFPMRLDPIWRPMLLAGGATPGRSYVEVTDKFVSFHFGVWSRQTISRDEIIDAAPRQWPVWYGVGWRSNLRGVIGLIGSYQGVVEVRLKSRVRAWGVFPCDRIAVSMQDPDGFIAALSDERAHATAPKTTATPAAQKKAPVRKRASRTRTKKS